MGRKQVRKIDAYQVIPHTSHNHTVTLLSGAKIGGIQFENFCYVAKVGGGLREPVNNRLEIRREFLASQATNILENESARTGLANSANGLRPHIAMVIIASVFSTDAERLAGWAASDQINSGKPMPVDLTHVLALDRPVRYVLNPFAAVVQYGFDRVGLPLDH